MPATRTSSARRSTAQPESEAYRAAWPSPSHVQASPDACATPRSVQRARPSPHERTNGHGAGEAGVVLWHKTARWWRLPWDTGEQRHGRWSSQWVSH
jgi:hypothetical protein